ncbi:gamma-glutamyltransferase [Lutimonas vermicola]|uniref:Glutathione hydrolase proenzyme n=1 Tax=Lutimonas vermicola TaxID=414288 RepID=A0ABU9KWU8_9FLAO
MKKLSFLFFFLLILANCKKPDISVEPVKGLIADSAMVVSARAEASVIGTSILKNGGNAFDAMIATDLALVVAYPFSGNIGGGGFTVFRTSNGTTGSLDYREKAPLAAHRDMYLDEKGEIIPEKSTLGAMAVGVPGTIAGLFELHQKFGSKPFSELIQPAIDLAKRGVVVTQKQAESLNNYRKYFKKANQRTIFLDKDWTAGDTIKYPALAKTFERIRDNGRAEFYEGKTADLLVDYLSELGGIITKEDLKKYKAVWREPIIFDYKGYKVISMPPPSSGGICIGQILKSIEPYDIGQYKHNSDKYIQLLSEAERRVYADRSFFLGDPDFNIIPLDTLLSSRYNNGRMEDFSWEKATPSSEVSHGNIDIIESNETTHYSIVDAFGNAVSVTNTLNGAYGSKVYVEEGGFFLNNQMDDLSSKPNSPNMFGLIGGEANSIEPEKRMLSSMTPTIVEKDGKLFMVVGSPGGSTIITSVLQNILNIIEFDMGMQESVAAPRFHHQWLPDVILFENSFDTIHFESLKQKGYQISQGKSRILGKVDAILVLPDGRLEGGADPRGDDTAVGF